VTAARRWYLLAFDLDRDDWRTFRLDRGYEARRDRCPGRPRGRYPAGDVAAFVAGQTPQTAPTYPADNVIHAPGLPRGGPPRRASHPESWAGWPLRQMNRLT
jgi:predicted DNA-binding transcriptional regulator YafY